MNKKYYGFIAAIIALVAVCSALTIGFITTSTQLGVYSGQLENLYEKSFSELLTNVNNIEVNLSKILASNGVETRTKLYEDVFTNCNYANANLSQLPVSVDSINKTTSFINKMGGFSYYAKEKLNNGEDLSQADVDSTSELYDLCKYIQQVLSDYVKEINYNFSILASYEQGQTGGFNTMFQEMQSESVKYPTLIYDGPFSESSKNTSVKGLSGEEIDREQAENVIQQAFKDYGINNLIFQGETISTVFSTFNFSFTSQSGRNYYVQVTKNGGLLLNITSYGGANKNEGLSLTECKAKAEHFAKNINLMVESVWATKLGGVAYINLTPVVGGVVIYPDMIKVKVSCFTGEILGWEASSYAHNHQDRVDLGATISLDEARNNVSSQLSIVEEKITLIPMQYGKEAIAYEFKGTINDAVYYVYISAQNGEELQVLKVVSTVNGEMLQ